MYHLRPQQENAELITASDTSKVKFWSLKRVDSYKTQQKFSTALPSLLWTAQKLHLHLFLVLPDVLHGHPVPVVDPGEGLSVTD